jgi:hypothetical protein
MHRADVRRPPVSRRRLCTSSKIRSNLVQFIYGDICRVLYLIRGDLYRGKLYVACDATSGLRCGAERRWRWISARFHRRGTISKVHFGGVLSRDSNHCDIIAMERQRIFTVAEMHVSEFTMDASGFTYSSTNAEFEIQLVSETVRRAAYEGCGMRYRLLVTIEFCDQVNENSRIKNTCRRSLKTSEPVTILLYR